MKKIAVIGGGASGLMAAIAAAGEGASVTIFEKNDRVGKKILQTGNGKCNYTNTNMIPECFYSSTDNGLISKILSSFDEKKVVDFFEKLGIVPRIRNGGIYPYPETATAVLDVLRMEIDRLGIRVKELYHLTDLKKINDKFIIKNEKFDNVILSTGGKSAPKTGSDGEGYKIAKKFGHKIIKPLPALTQLKSEAGYFKSLSGVRAEATLSLYIEDEFIRSSHGELQLVDSGLSGICTFELSSLASRALNEGKRVSLRINFFKDYSKTQFFEFLKKRIEMYPERTAEQILTGIFNKKLALTLLKLSSVKSSTVVNKIAEDNLSLIADNVSAFRVEINDVGDFNKSQVTSGGISLLELTDKLESCKCRGLYFAGEILDVDGICGGYNLQWAWSSGYCAGRAAAND